MEDYTQNYDQKKETISPDDDNNEIPNQFIDSLQDKIFSNILDAAKNMEFEEAARIRDQIDKLEKEL